MKVTAVIVAKRDSKRLKSKNMLPFGYGSLLTHKISQLKRCNNIDEIIVGSNCSEILKESMNHGAIGVLRPEEYCDEDNCSANKMIENMCSLIETDVVVWSHCTNPLIKPSTYDEAVSLFFSKTKQLDSRGKYGEEFDSLVSVSLVQEHFWGKHRDDEDNSYSYPINHSPHRLEHTLAKDLPKIYKQNGAIFIQKYEQMKENNYFYGENPYLYTTPEKESLDINTELDYKIAKYVHESFFI